MKRIFLRAASAVLAAVMLVACMPLCAGAAEEAELLSEVQGTVPELHINIDQGYSLDTIHNDKDAKIRAHAQIGGAWDESFNMDTTPIELKTRGNSSFDFMKKPYQMKFDSKTDLFGMGKAKKWVLLANYVDGSFIRNKIVFDLAEAIGMPYVCKSVFVDLYIDGDYKGVYQLCEKVEIGDNRVPLEDDFGVIAEMESIDRVAGEEFYFYTDITGKPFVYKEYNTDFEETEDSAVIKQSAEVKAFFEDRINTLESELYYGGDNWALVESLIDVDSFIQFYFINEFCENVDATLASTYFYIGGKDDVLHMGPVWDYDRSFGSYTDGYEQGSEADFLKNITDSADHKRVEWFKMLFQYPEFVSRVNEMYDEVIKDAFEPERINATIDAYQELLMPSLMKNYVNKGWPIFHSISIAEFFSNEKDAADYIEYTTNAIKNNIAKRKEYLDKAYGKYHPVLFYTVNGAGRTYTGGSMTDAVGAVSGLELSVDSIIDGGITYTYASGRSYNDAVASGGKTFSGIKISLTGNLANYYSVQYRALLNGSWSAWKSDGALAGYAAAGYTATRLQIRLVEKAEVVFGTVSFDCGPLGAQEPVSSVVGNEVVLPVLSDTEEYIFGGWYTSGELSGEAVTSVVIGEGDTVLYAKTEAIKTETVRGDIDGDGTLNGKDANFMVKIIASTVALTPELTALCDLNADGSVNGKDANILSRIIAGAEV